jgi:hypothetical protein
MGGQNHCTTTLSDLRNQQQESLDTQSLKEVLEVRLIGASVNSGSAPIEFISKLLKEISLSIHRAANKITTGKNSSKTTSTIRRQLAWPVHDN